MSTENELTLDNQKRIEELLNRGEIDEAIQLLEREVKQHVSDAVLWVRLGLLHLQQRRHNYARACALKAMPLKLISPKVALDLIKLLTALGESSLLINMVRQIPPEYWDSAQSLSEVAHALHINNANEDANTYAQAAYERDSRHPPSLHILATAKVFSGDLVKAGEYSKACLEIIPGDPGTYWLMSKLRLPERTGRIEEIKTRIKGECTNTEKTWLAYALHNELHDIGEYDEAWDALQQACSAKLSEYPYDEQENISLYNELFNWSKEEVNMGDGYVDATLSPIFILGLHRSGTTLAERILSGHSEVTPCGETYDITTQLRVASGRHFAGEIEKYVVERRDKLNYNRIGKGYINGINWRSNGRRFITDKLPSNYLNIGFIARALPNAKFIHLNRDPLDVGLSNLRTLFNKACAFSYDQMHFCRHFDRYTSLMSVWRTLLGDRILDVNYDELVREPHVQAERMAAFVGLKYQPNMIEIEKRKDSVSTASSVMMRDGIRKDRGMLWMKYEKHLQPMINFFEK